MDRLSIYISMLSGSVLTGSLAITAFSLGYYNWWAIGLVAIVGFTLAWPTGFLVSRLIKKNDPHWHRTPKDARGTGKEV